MLIECPKCQGAGAMLWYSHVANGVCFDCHGRGTLFWAPAKEGPLTPAQIAEMQAEREKNPYVAWFREAQGSCQGSRLSSDTFEARYSESFPTFAEALAYLERNRNAAVACGIRDRLGDATVRMC